MLQFSVQRGRNLNFLRPQIFALGSSHLSTAAERARMLQFSVQRGRNLNFLRPQIFALGSSHLSTAAERARMLQFSVQRDREKPDLYGFESTSVACCATGMFEMGYACSRGRMFSCSDASKYVFWDSFHPTEKTNEIVAKYVMQHVLSHFAE